VERAIQEADLLWFLVDAKEGLHPLDEIVAERLRQTHKKVFLVVNKADNEALTQSAYEFLSLGIEPMFTISVTQKKGIHELVEKSLELLPAVIEEEAPEEGPRALGGIRGFGRVGGSHGVDRISTERRDDRIDTLVSICRDDTCWISSTIRVGTIDRAVSIVIHSIGAILCWSRCTGWICSAISICTVDGSISIVIDTVIADLDGSSATGCEDDIDLS